MNRRSMIAIAGLALALPFVLTACRLADSRRLVRESTPWTRGGVGPVILVVGDSTGEGTGSSDGRLSIAGRLGARWPQAPVRNRSRDGAKMAEIADRLREVASQPRPVDGYRVVVVMGGGNDILLGTDPARLEQDLVDAFAAAKSLGAPVVFMGAGNVGTAPMFAWPVSWWLSRRARSTQAIFDRASRAAGVTRVKLFYEPESDPFLTDPQRFFAKDGLHPSDDGYGLWWEELRKVLPSD